MNKHPARWCVVAVALLLLAACQDRRDPVKPTTATVAAAPTAPAV